MVMVAAEKGSELDRERKRQLLKALTYEKVNGRAIYHRDYKDSVERVVWFLTEVEKVLYAQRGQKWLIQGWDEELELLESLSFSIKKLMEEEDV